MNLLLPCYYHHIHSFQTHKYNDFEYDNAFQNKASQMRATAGLIPDHEK